MFLSFYDITILWRNIFLNTIYKIQYTKYNLIQNINLCVRACVCVCVCVCVCMCVCVCGWVCNYLNIEFMRINYTDSNNDSNF